MSEMSNIKLNAYLNQVFPGGALFLVANDHEFKRLFMELSNEVLGAENCRKVYAATMVGRNVTRSNNPEWIFGPNLHISPEGQLIAEA